MKLEEFKRWLVSRGVMMAEGANHTKLYYDDKRSTLPRHKGEIAEGTRKAILKQLGL